METDSKKSKNSHNKIGFYFFIAVMFFSSVWASYFTFFNNKIDLAEYPSQQEEKKVPEGLMATEQAKPWVTTANLVTHGNKLYQAQCALCHGAKGLGDGTPGLIPPPRNLVEGKWKVGGSPQALFGTLQKGIEGSSMVSFKHLPKVDRWALVHYIRSITNNKVAFDDKELEEFAKTAL